MTQSKRIVSAFGLLLACEEAPPGSPSCSAVASGSAVIAASATDPAPIASELPQSPGCKEALVTTLCGRTVRCRTNDEDRKLFREGEVVATDRDDCLRALREVRETLRAIEKQPLAHGDWPLPVPATTCMPEMAEQQRAYREILARVRMEGVARAGKRNDAGAAKYWQTLIRERFDLSTVTAGCRGEQGFLVSVGSDVGAPGSLPYSGLFRLAPGKAPDMLAELSDVKPMTHWSAGDLDGDGVDEEVVRFLLRNDAGDSQGARYELADASRDKLLPIEERPNEDANSWPEEPVAGVSLPSGRALAVGKRLLVYADHKLVDAPASAVEERRVFEKRASERARAVLTKLDAPLPPGEPCSDARLGFALKLAAELRQAGVIRGWTLFGLAGELTRTTSCPEWARLGLDR